MSRLRDVVSMFVASVVTSLGLALRTSAGSVSIPSTRYPSTFEYRYRIDTLSK